MNYHILWTETARKDMQDILLYIHQDNPVAARQTLKRIQTRAETLTQFPQRGRQVPELKDLALHHEYRELIEYPWRLIYRIDQQQVYILAILDGRRELNDLLHARLNRTPDNP